MCSIQPSFWSIDGRDAVRWYTAARHHLGDDGDFQQQRFSIWSTTHLAIRSANLLNRTTSWPRRWLDNAVPPCLG